MVQIQSSSNLDANLSKIESYVKQAKVMGAELVVFPEMAYFTGPKEAWLKIVPRFDELKLKFQSWSEKYKIAICPGSLRKPVPGEAEKYFNALVFFTPEKNEYGYDKIFLYQAVLPDKTYEEGRYCSAGKSLQVIEWKGLKIGFAICFDLRFPEVFRSLKKKGAELVLLPSAFTIPTGEAHWEVLVRARAIENQFFVLAPDLTGVSGDNAGTYGHSLAIDPWGKVLQSFGSEEGIKTFSVDIKEIEQAASKVASWKCRREDLFPIV